MGPVSDQRGAVESLPGTQAYPGRNEVARVADGPGKGECGEMGWSEGVNESAEGLDAGHARADEDGGHDGEAGSPLRYLGVQGESEPERHGGQGVAEVGDEVGQQGDAAAGDEHEGLSDGGEPQDCE